jgi:hypothetical protein
MTLTKSLPRIEEHRVTVHFECPKCQSQSVGTAYDLRETIRVSTRVPKWGWQSHWVRCAKCKSELHADCSAKELVGASATTVSGHIRAYIPFPKRFMAMASLVLCWAPVLGVGVGLMAVVVNWRTSGWPRWVSLMGLMLGTGINVWMFTTLLTVESEFLQPVAMVHSDLPT